MLDQPVPNPLAKNPNFNTHKVFAAIGLILIALILIGGGIWYFVQSAEDKAGSDDTIVTKVATTSAKTANWKTYTNTDLGFSIKHPSDMDVKKDNLATLSENGSTVNVLFVTFSLKPENDERNRVNVTCQTTDKTLDQLLLQNNTPFSQYPLKDIEWKKTTIDSEKAVISKDYLKTAARLDFYDAFVVKNNKVCQIRLVLSLDTKVDLNSLIIYNSMISTFKFL